MRSGAIAQAVRQTRELRQHRQSDLRDNLRSTMESMRLRDIEDEKARRRAARRLIGDYHDEQLRLLLQHVRDGFEKLDAGELDPFGLDELIHRYKRSARKLWSFCGSSGAGWERAALTLESLREQGEEEPDWWAAGERHRQDG
jgi:hypothetical protein